MRRLLAVALLLAVVAALPARASDAPDGRRLLLDCEKRFLKLESIRGTMRTRSVVHGGGRAPGEIQERLSDFVYSRFDRVRFEHSAPLEHSVIWNGKTLWIWSPRENAALEQPAGALSPATRALLSVQPGFGLDLLAPLPLDSYRVRAETAPPDAGGDVVVTLSPSDDRPTLQVVVDTGRTLVTRILARAGGTVVSDVRLVKPVEAKPGVWFATQVESRQLLADGSTLEELRTYERLAFDAPVDPARFEFALPEGATRVPVEALAKFAGGADP